MSTNDMQVTQNKKRKQISLLLLLLIGCGSMGWYACSTVPNKELQITSKASDLNVPLVEEVTSFFGGNSRETLGLKPYIDWVENKENGLRIEKLIGNYKYSLQYMPSEYMVLKNLEDLNVSTDVINKKKVEYDKYVFYLFVIEDTLGKEELLRSGIKTSKEYYERVEYFSYQMQSDLQLVAGSDTLPCRMHHFERVFGLSPKGTFIVGFDRPKTEDNAEAFVFVYNDRVMGTGPVKIKIINDNLETLPLLVMEKNQ